MFADDDAAQCLGFVSLMSGVLGLIENTLSKQGHTVLSLRQKDVAYAVIDARTQLIARPPQSYVCTFY